MTTEERYALIEKHLAIFTDADKPCAKLLVFVESPDQDTTKLFYINDDLFNKRKKVDPLTVHGALERSVVTSINKFGLKIKNLDFAFGEITLEQVTESQATYHDGERRLWQPEWCDENKTVIHKNAFEIIRKLGQ